MDLSFIGTLVSIVVIDLVLSGDNAVVIGMAANRLPKKQRRQAIIWGGAGAVILRMFFTLLAALLLGIPLLGAIGSIFLFWIAFKLLKPADTHTNIQAAGSLREALQTIIVADLVMSLDNILAVGGASDGHLGLLLFGLALSIPLLLFASNLIASLIDRYAWLNYVGSGVLVVAAARMFIEDPVFHDLVDIPLWGEIVLIGIAVAIVLGIGYLKYGQEPAEPDTQAKSAGVAADNNERETGQAGESLPTSSSSD